MGRRSNKDTSNTFFETFKIRLKPTKAQKRRMNQYFGLSRFLYNWAIDTNYLRYNEFLMGEAMSRLYSDITMTTMLTEMKSEEEFSWMNQYSVDSMRNVIHEALVNMEFELNSRGAPLFNHKRKKAGNREAYYIRADRFHIWDGEVRIPDIRSNKVLNSVKTYPHNYEFERNYHDLEYSKVMIVYELGEYYVTGSINRTLPKSIPKNSKDPHVVGIDIGIKKSNWIVDSDYTVVQMPDVQRIDKKIEKLVHKYEQKQLVNDLRTFKDDNQALIKGRMLTNKRNPTKREVKLRQRIQREFRHKTNKFNNEIYQYTSNLMKSKPDAIVIEELSSLRMIEEFDESTCMSSKGQRGFNRQVMNARAFKIKRHLTTTCAKYGIPLIKASGNYPSTQLCSCCGHRFTGTDKLSLSDREYVCPDCGSVIDRDLNSSFNLKYLGWSYLEYEDFPESHAEYSNMYELIQY